MARKIYCEVCGTRATASNNRQKTCLGRECKLRLRGEIRKRERREDRKRNPIQCVWCLEPITEIGKRKYHPECKEDKNRLRVRDYNRTHAPAPGPKKSRTYKGTVTCFYCRKKVKRTGARQIICGDRECHNARKRDRKREAKERRRELEALRSRKRERPRSSKTTADPLIYCLSI